MNINERMFWFLRSESQRFLAIQHNFILFTYTVSNPNLYILSYILRFQQKNREFHIFFLWKKKVLSAYFLIFFPELCLKFILYLQTRVEALRSTIFFFLIWVEHRRLFAQIGNQKNNSCKLKKV